MSKRLEHLFDRALPSAPPEGKVSLLPLLLLSIPLWLAPTGAAAEVYKWVDEDGKVHYGDAPPTQGNSATIRTDPPPSDTAVDQSRNRLDTLREQAAVLNKEREEREKKKEANEQEKTEQRQRCLQAKNDLRVAEFDGRVFHWDEQGNRVYLEDDERAAKRARAQKEVDTYCR